MFEIWGIIFLAVLLPQYIILGIHTEKQEELKNQENYWYILISASKFFFNYRHTNNILQIYYNLKDNGVTDDRIILFLPDNYACNPRNPVPGEMFYMNKPENCYLDDIEIDYRDYDVSSQNILNLLRGRYDENLPISKRLLSDSNSKIMIYVSSHGGDNFIKIQDTDIIQSEDLANVFNEMYIKKRYKEILMVTDTCRAVTLYDEVNSPNLILLASVDRHQDEIATSLDSYYHLFKGDYFSEYFSTHFAKGRSDPGTVSRMIYYLNTHYELHKIGMNIVLRHTYPSEELYQKARFSDFFGDPFSRKYKITNYKNERELEGLFEFIQNSMQ